MNRVLQDQYRGLKLVFEKSFRLLTVLARGNPVVQKHIFDRLDSLLETEGAEADLAESLTEVRALASLFNQIHNASSLGAGLHR